MTNIDTKNNFPQRVWMATAIVALVVVLLLLFKTLFSTLLLVLAAALLAIFFHACAELLQQYLHLNSKLSLIIAVIVIILLVAGFFWFVGTRLQSQVQRLSDTLPATIDNARQQIEKLPAGQKVLDYLKSSGDSRKTMTIAKTFFSSSFGILSDLYIILLLAAFFIASPALYKRGLVHLFPPKAKERGNELLSQLKELLKNWLKGQIFGFFFIAVLTGIGLWALGMPLVLTLALIAGLLNFIPNFGPVIALVPAVLIALTIGQTTAILVACLYTFIQVVQSAVTQPLIQKKMVDIPPALVIFGQVAMGLLAGFWGVLLATPLIAILMKLVNKLYVEKQADHLYQLESTD